MLQFQQFRLGGCDLVQHVAGVVERLPVIQAEHEQKCVTCRQEGWESSTLMLSFLIQGNLTFFCICAKSLTCENGQPALGGEVPLAGSVQEVHLVCLSSDVEQFPVEVLGSGLVALVELVAQEPLEDVGFADPGCTEHHYSVTVLGLGQSQLQQVHGPLRLSLGGRLPTRGAGGRSVRHRLPPALLDHPDDAHAGLGEVGRFGVLLGHHRVLSNWVRDG